ncbi:MAG TPA: cupredoxin domain-containing protein [Candidatus Elarobacter sp.]|nr:cupredoxin domain-containing protein [Candidatus Elarobacter sp.]
MRLSAIVLGVAVLAIAAVPASAAKPAPKPLPAVNIVATADQKFAPDHVVLHAGKRQTLSFTSTGGVHGIASTALGIPATMITADKPVSVTVTPKKTGTYKLPCTIVCGAGHADMALTIVVKP